MSVKTFQTSLLKIDFVPAKYRYKKKLLCYMRRKVSMY